MSGKPITVLLVDDHRLVAESLRVVLQMARDIEVVGTACTGLEAVQMAVEQAPNVVLMDVRLPGCDGIQATAAIKTRRPQVKVVILTAVTDEEVLVQAIEAGASGYLTKDRAVGDVVDAVRRAAAGEILAPPGVLAGLLTRYVRGRRRTPSDQRVDLARQPLTRREIEILRAIASGLDNNAIAELFVISPHTLRTHFRNILSKLKVHSRLEAVTVALRLGLIDLPGEPPAHTNAE